MIETHRVVKCVACGMSDHAVPANPGVCVACGAARLPVILADDPAECDSVKAAERKDDF